MAGISGTVAGSELSKQLGKFTRKAEAIVCASGMLLATPFLFLAIVVAQYRLLYVAWVSQEREREREREIGREREGGREREFGGTPGEFACVVCSLYLVDVSSFRCLSSWLSSSSVSTGLLLLQCCWLVIMI